MVGVYEWIICVWRDVGVLWGYGYVWGCRYVCGGDMGVYWWHQRSAGVLVCVGICGGELAGAYVEDPGGVQWCAFFYQGR